MVSVEPRCIAAARNGGAAVARGELLAFVDADSRIHPETFNAVDEAMASGAVVAGATGVELERWSADIALTYAHFMPKLCFGLLLGRTSAHELIEAYWYRACG